MIIQSDPNKTSIANRLSTGVIYYTEDEEEEQAVVTSIVDDLSD